MLLRLDRQFLDMEGNPLPLKLDDTLANVLAMSNFGRPSKMIGWAEKLINDGEIEIDADEAKFLKELIEKTYQITNLAKDQLLEQIGKLLKD